MTREVQKVRERQHLEILRRACPDFPGGDVQQQESPDFVIGDDLVGVEVTGIYRTPEPGNRPMKEQESLRTRVVEGAERLCTEAGLPGLYVSAYFSQLLPTAVPELSSTLASVVADNVPGEGERLRLEFGRGSTWDRRELQVVTIARPDGYEDSLWDPSGAAQYLAPISPAVVQDCIDGKSAKLGGYKDRFGETWLLLVMDDFSHSGHFNISPATLGHEYQAGFDRVWLATTFEGDVNDLTVR